MFSLALKSDGTVCAWGDNVYDELGNPTSEHHRERHPGGSARARLVQDRRKSIRRGDSSRWNLRSPHRRDRGRQLAARAARETVTMYGVGFGAVTPDFAAGQIVTADNKLSLPLQLTFGQTPALLSYYGLAPNFVGLYQFDVMVPSVPDDDLVPLTFNLGGTASAQTLYTAVHQ
jgi:hypothetical protein